MLFRSPEARPCVATLRPNVFGMPEPSADAAPEVVTIDAPLGAEQLGVRAVRLERPEREERDVAESTIIVSGACPSASSR